MRNLYVLVLLCLLMHQPGLAQESGDATDVPPAPQADTKPSAADPKPAEQLSAQGVEEESATNVAEGGAAAKTGPAPPVTTETRPSEEQAVSGSGTATGSNGVFNPQRQRQAGNAAEQQRSGPGRRGTVPNAAEASSAPPVESEQPGAGVPADLQTDERLFQPDDLSSSLPGIARDQPGLVQTPPGELLTGANQVQGFTTLLGPSQLPSSSVPDIVGRLNSDPGYELQTNFGRLVVPTGTITGSTKSKQFHIEGGLTVYYDQVAITADAADIDEKEEIAVLKGNVIVNDPKYSLSTEELRIRFEDKQFQATGYVQFKKNSDPAKSRPNLGLPKKDRLREYFAGQQFELYCMDLHYNWDSKQLIALESVRMVHPSFAGTMDRVDYDDKTKRYVIDGNVQLDVSKYDWIFENQLADEADVEKARAVTNKPTRINCDRLLYSEESGLAQFFSLPDKTVLFDQSERKISGSYLEINDQTKDFHVEGTVSSPLNYDQQSGEWLMAGGLVKRDEVSQELKDVLAKPLSATAQRMTYNFDRKRLELSGAVKLTTEGKSLQADSIVQDETAKYFLMQGNVMIEPDADSKVYAAQVYLDTANDVVSFVGLVQGRFKNDDLAVTNSSGSTAEGTPLQPQADTSGLFGNPGGGLPQRSGSGVQPGIDSGANVAEAG